MKLTAFMIRNLGRRATRTLLAIFTLLIAAFLFTVLVSVPASINRIAAGEGSKLRVIVSAPNAYMLPIWYRDAIRKMPHVTAATAELQWGAIYRDPRQPIIAFGVDPDVVRVFPEGNLTPDEVAALNRDHRAAMVGRLLLEKYHWHLGQPATLTNMDKKISLSFIPVAILPALRDQNAFVFRRELLDQAVHGAYGVDISDRATFIAVRVDKAEDIPLVIDEIDGRFHNSEYETSTITESDALANAVSAIADLRTIIASLCAVVVITVLLVAANSMAINVRERISEVAVIRALGFGGQHVAAMLFGEAFLMGVVGGGAGAGLALALFGRGITLGAVLGGQGYLQVTAETAIAGALAVVVVSLAAAVVPVIQALSISPALAFRKVI
jgi:putative ABC transport system permease protein